MINDVFTQVKKRQNEIITLGKQMAEIEQSSNEKDTNAVLKENVGFWEEILQEILSPNALSH